MHFDTKIAIVLDDQLAVWQKANVTAFLMSDRRNRRGTRRGAVRRRLGNSLSADVPAADHGLRGRPHRLRRAYERAMARDVQRLAIFTHDLFATPHDQANRAAVASVPAAELDFAGIALHADRKTVDKVLDKLRPHP